MKLKYPNTWDKGIHTQYEKMLLGKKANVPSCFRKEIEPIYNIDDYVMNLGS